MPHPKPTFRAKMKSPKPIERPQGPGILDSKLEEAKSAFQLQRYSETMFGISLPSVEKSKRPKNRHCYRPRLHAGGSLLGLFFAPEALGHSARVTPLFVGDLKFSCCVIFFWKFLRNGTAKATLRQKNRLKFFCQRGTSESLVRVSRTPQ